MSSGRFVSGRDLCGKFTAEQSQLFMGGGTADETGNRARKLRDGNEDCGNPVGMIGDAVGMICDFAVYTLTMLTAAE